MVEKLDHEKIREAVKKLPAGTKERIAWEQIGEGNVSREAFRDIWLEERVPTTKKPETAKPAVNSSKPKGEDK